MNQESGKSLSTAVSVEHLFLKIASSCYQKNKQTSMLAALERLPQEDKIDFLLKRDMLDMALPIMREMGEY